MGVRGQILPSPLAGEGMGVRGFKSVATVATDLATASAPLTPWHHHLNARHVEFLATWPRWPGTLGNS
jgi:hypothetical protein